MRDDGDGSSSSTNDEPMPSVRQYDRSVAVIFNFNFDILHPVTKIMWILFLLDRKFQIPNSSYLKL